MYKFLKLLFVILSFYSADIKAENKSHKCTTPAAYNLETNELNDNNKNYYCWEIKYLKEYHNQTTMNFSSYKDLFLKITDLTDVEIQSIRELGITPEKLEYIYKHFIDTNSKKDKIKQIKNAVYNAENTLELLYVYGRPVYFVRSLYDWNLLKRLFDKITLGIFNQLRIITIYQPVLMGVLGVDCITNWSSGLNFSDYPWALKPVGVVGNYIVNSFAEIVGEIKGKDFGVYRLGENTPFANWNNTGCRIFKIENDVKNTLSCISCDIFEIAFNTVSRVGYVMYDKLTIPATHLMIILFLLWTLFMFFENVIKKQDEFSFIKMFWNKIIFVFIVGVFLTIKISDENNIINYFVEPVTNFVFGYTEKTTEIINSFDKGKSEQLTFKCNYTPKNTNTEFLFSNDARKNIVCSIQRVNYFNKVYMTVGKYQIIMGFKNILNLYISKGIFKILIGITIFGMFFMYNLTMSYFFIESLFRIAVVMFLFPLFLMGYAFDKGKKFVEDGFNTLLSGLFQLVSLSLVSLIISLIMMFLLNIDIIRLQQSAISGNKQEILSSLIYLMQSFNPNMLLQFIYTSLISWMLMGEAMTIANKFSGFGKKETLGQNFTKHIKSIIAVSTNVARNAKDMYLGSKKTANKLNKMINKDLKITNDK